MMLRSNQKGEEKPGKTAKFECDFGGSLKAAGCVTGQKGKSFSVEMKSSGVGENELQCVALRCDAMHCVTSTLLK